MSTSPGFAPVPRPPVPPPAPKLQTPSSRRPVVAEEVLSETPAGEQNRDAIGILDMLRALVAYGGSDLHVPANAPTKVRVSGRLRNLIIAGRPLILEPDEVRRILLDISTQEQLAIFEEKHELDFAYDYPGVARFRVNYLYARGNLQGVFRIIPHEIKTLEQLNMPPILRTLAGSPRGLVLVTGPTGSGKSTTLAAMMDHINSTKECHILTLEDPIEFVHQSKKALVSQRELHSDTFSFTSALKAALREDPDVILVGEMRDPETIELGLTAAETGHLVFGTLHTQDASQTVDRIIDSFAADQQAQIRAQLSLALRGVISQQLIRTVDGEGRVAALEVMVANSGIRNMLREGQTAQLYSAMQTGQKEGMQTMDTSLAQHIQSGKITKQTAATISSNPKELDRLIATGLKSLAPDLKRPSR